MCRQVCTSLGEDVAMTSTSVFGPFGSAHQRELHSVKHGHKLLPLHLREREGSLDRYVDLCGYRYEVRLGPSLLDVSSFSPRPTLRRRNRWRLLDGRLLDRRLLLAVGGHLDVSLRRRVASKLGISQRCPILSYKFA